MNLRKMHILLFVIPVVAPINIANSKENRMKRAFILSGSLLQQRRIVQNPTVQGLMVNIKTTFFHHFFDIPVAQGIGHVPTNTL